MVVNVIGGGLAGSEAAWQAAERGCQVKLWEMRPQRQTPAHHTGQLSELVCSNSLGSEIVTSGGGLLKAEMKVLDSLILRAAQQARVPAGGALAVDRQLFAACVSKQIEDHPNITIVRQECRTLPREGITIIATGPLTSEGMEEVIGRLTSQENLYFYDAAAPIVTGESVDYSRGFWASRYQKGTDDYFNCPLTREEYDQFYEQLIEARQAPLHEGVEDQVKVFEGCMPIEVMAKRGKETLLYGPLKPVGLIGPDGRRPYAVVQLRKENTEASLFNLVGFQTRLAWREQRRVFRLIPALHSAEFVRYGVMHRNTFINSPELLQRTYQLKAHPTIFIAGQLTGVEGYMESASSGLIAGLNAVRVAGGQEPLVFPETTIIGALSRYIVTCAPNSFQPMNANFGILPPLEERIKDKAKRKEAYAARSLKDLQEFVQKRL